jgi:hypothetical protein
MDLIVESDIYEPCIDENGNYVDYIPPSSKFKNGMRCPCGSRKEHNFDSRQSFTGHIKTKTHQKWIADMNINKMNYYTENFQLKDTINNVNNAGGLGSQAGDLYNSTGQLLSNAANADGRC